MGWSAPFTDLAEGYVGAEFGLDLLDAGHATVAVLKDRLRFGVGEDLELEEEGWGGLHMYMLVVVTCMQV